MHFATKHNTQSIPVARPPRRGESGQDWSYDQAKQLGCVYQFQDKYYLSGDALKVFEDSDNASIIPESFPKTLKYRGIETLAVDSEPEYTKRRLAILEAFSKSTWDAQSKHVEALFECHFEKMAHKGVCSLDLECRELAFRATLLTAGSSGDMSKTMTPMEREAFDNLTFLVTSTKAQHEWDDKIEAAMNALDPFYEQVLAHARASTIQTIPSILENKFQFKDDALIAEIHHMFTSYASLSAVMVGILHTIEEARKAHDTFQSESVPDSILERVVNIALNRFMPIPTTSAEATRDILVNDKLIPKGSVLFGCLGPTGRLIDGSRGCPMKSSGPVVAFGAKDSPHHCPTATWSKQLLRSFAKIAVESIRWQAQWEDEPLIVDLAEMYPAWGYQALVTATSKLETPKRTVKQVHNDQQIKQRRRIAVVGAGIGGITAARELVDNGYEVVIFEAADKPFNKSQTIEVESNHYNLGSHLVAPDGAVANLAFKHGVKMKTQKPTSQINLMTGKSAERDDTRSAATLGKLVSALHEHGEMPQHSYGENSAELAAPAGAWLNRHDLQGAKDHFLQFYTGAGYALDATSIPALYVVKFAKESGLGLRVAATPEGGFEHLLTQVSHDLNIRLSTPVRSITPQGCGARDGVLVNDEHFDGVVLACLGGEHLLQGDCWQPHRELLQQIVTFDYATVVLKVAGFRLEEGLYLVDDAQRGHISAMAQLGDPDNEVIVVFGYPETDQDEEGFGRSVQLDMEGICKARGIQVETKVLLFKKWKYFPHVSSLAISKGFYNDLDNLQGQAGVWFAGGIATFELTDCVVAHSTYLVNEKFLSSAKPVTKRLHDSTFKALPQVSTLLDSLLRGLTKTPERMLYKCLEGKRTSFTWESLVRSSLALSEQLCNAGLSRGDTAVLVFPPESAQFPVALWGCLLAGVIAIPIAPANPYRSNQETERFKDLIESCGAKFAITDSAYHKHIRLTGGLRAAGKFLTSFISSAPTNSAWPSDLTWVVTDHVAPVQDTMSELVLQVEELCALACPSDVAYLQFSSGSTSKPKGIIVTHRMALHNCGVMVQSITALPSVQHRIDRETGQIPSWMAVSWLPWWHDFGLVSGFLLAVTNNSAYVFFSPVSFLKTPAMWIRAISEFKADSTGAPNFALDYAASRVSDDQLEDVDLSSLIQFPLGGEPVKVESMHNFSTRFGKHGFNFRCLRNTYGAAENTLYITGGDQVPAVIQSFDRNQLEGTKRAVRPIRAGVSGTPSLSLVSIGCSRYSETGIHVLVVNPDTREIVPDQTAGELWIGGDSTSAGYWGSKGMIRKHLACDTNNLFPFIASGDQGFKFKGRLFLSGRLKNMIIIAGRNIFPQDIESAIDDSHPLLRRGCAVAFGSKDETHVILLAEVRENKNLAEAHARAMEALGKRCNTPVQLVLVAKQAIPKTTSGKIRHCQAKTDFFNGKIKIVYDVTGTSSPRDEGDIVAEEVFELPPAIDDVAVILQVMQTLLANFLSIEPQQLHADSNVAYLGLSSVHIVSLVHQLEDWSNVHIEPGLFMEHGSSLGSLAEMLHKQMVSEQRNNPEPEMHKLTKSELQTDQNVFCIHPAGGSIQQYVQMANNGVPKKVCVYAIQSSKVPEFHSVEQLAASYAKLVTAIQPEGPYTIIGYSAGGAIAYEMITSHLKAKVNLKLIDAPSPRSTCAQSLPEQDIDERTNRVFKHFSQSLKRSGIANDTTSFDVLQKHIANHSRAVLQYNTPKLNSFEGNAIIYRAAQEGGLLLEHWASKRSDFGWSEFIHDIDILKVDGDHMTCVENLSFNDVLDTYDTSMKSTSSIVKHVAGISTDRVAKENNTSFTAQSA